MAEPVLVVDASVALSWCFEDEVTKYTERVLDAVRERGGIVPALWLWEIANGLLTAERRGRLTRAKSAAFVSSLSSLPLELDRAQTLNALEPVIAIARETGLSAYDAAYLATAGARGMPLATRDEGLRRAASVLGVPVWKR